MRTKSVWTKWLVLIFSIALLASCGGGGGGGPAPVPSGGGEGSIASPVNLGTVSSTVSHSGSIGAGGTSYYRFTSGAADVYTISLTNTQSDLSWEIYSSSNFSSGLIRWCDNNTSAGPANETCTVTLSASTTYYLMVEEWDLVAGTYTLAVTPPATSAPAAPTGVAANGTYGKVTVTWFAVTGATSYNVYWSTTAGAGTLGTRISGLPVSSSTYDHVVTTTGIPYYYVVTAQNAIGESLASTQVSGTPLAPMAPPLAYTFDDGTLQGWTTNGIWNVTTQYAYSLNYSVTDSPLGNYQDSTNTSLTSPMMDLTATTAPNLTFWHRYQTEAAYDKAYVEISTDGGTTYTNITPDLGGYYSGLLSVFTLVTIDLAPYKTFNRVVIRFRLYTDNVVMYDGWYIDDIGISAI